MLRWKFWFFDEEPYRFPPSFVVVCPDSRYLHSTVQQNKQLLLLLLTWGGLLVSEVHRDPWSEQLFSNIFLKSNRFNYLMKETEGNELNFSLEQTQETVWNLLRYERWQETGTRMYSEFQNFWFFVLLTGTRNLIGTHLEDHFTNR